MLVRLHLVFKPLTHPMYPGAHVSYRARVVRFQVTDLESQRLHGVSVSCHRTRFHSACDIGFLVNFVHKYFIFLLFK